MELYRGVLRDDDYFLTRYSKHLQGSTVWRNLELDLIELGFAPALHSDVEGEKWWWDGWKESLRRKYNLP